jgi:hypothetical protein
MVIDYSADFLCELWPDICSPDTCSLGTCWPEMQRKRKDAPWQEAFASELVAKW